MISSAILSIFITTSGAGHSLAKTRSQCEQQHSVHFYFPYVKVTTSNEREPSITCTRSHPRGREHTETQDTSRRMRKSWSQIHTSLFWSPQSLWTGILSHFCEIWSWPMIERRKGLVLGAKPLLLQRKSLNSRETTQIFCFYATLLFPQVWSTEWCNCQIIDYIFIFLNFLYLFNFAIISYRNRFTFTVWVLNDFNTFCTFDFYKIFEIFEIFQVDH